MGPQNYTLGNVIDPGLAFSGGLQMGEQRLMQQQQQAMAMQQQQAALQAQQRREQALQRVLSNPRAGAREYGELMLLMPEKHEAIKQSWGMQNTEQSKSRLSDLTQWTAAIEAGKPEFAVSAMLSQADLLDAEAGQATPEGQALRAQAEIVKADPMTAARVLLKPLLFAHPDGGKVLDNIAKQGGEERAAELQPLKVRQETADATTKEVAAKYAAPKALADLEKTGWDIKAIQNDIAYKKEANRIAAMQAEVSRLAAGRANEAAREGNDLKRQELELKIEEARGKLDTAAREKVAEFDSRISGVTDARTLIKEIKGLREEAWINPTGVTASAGFFPGTNARTQFGKIDQLKNVLSLEYLDKLKGPTSDRDIAFLKAIAANLDSLQSDASFAGELDKVDAALARVDAATRKKYGAPPAAKPSKPAPAGNTGGVTVSGW